MQTVHESADRVQYLTKILENPETPIKSDAPALKVAPVEPPKAPASGSFVHDVVNGLAIAIGKTNQAIRLVDQLSDPKAANLRDKVMEVANNLKRMQKLIDVRRKDGK